MVYISRFHTHNMETAKRLEAISRSAEWAEWSDHSLFQRESCAREFRTSGKIRSNTSSFFATTPWASDKFIQRLKPEESVDGMVYLEVGSSTGPMFQKILRATTANIRMILIESNRRAAKIIREKFPDDRLEIHNINCKNIAKLCEELGIKAHWILTSFPMTNDLEFTNNFLNQCKDDCLSEVGRVLAWNYKPWSVDPLANVFGEENCERFTAWRNLPPLWSIEAGLKNTDEDRGGSQLILPAERRLILP
jgi:phospholipid N-methyltransferase